MAQRLSGPEEEPAENLGQLGLDSPAGPACRWRVVDRVRVGLHRWGLDVTLDPRGRIRATREVAVVLNLLQDGGSPLYLPDRRGAHQDELEAILPGLTGRGQGASI